MKSSDLHRIPTPCRPSQLTAFISVDESISSCSHLRCSFFGTHGEKLHNPLQESCPSLPFLWSGPDPSGALAGCNTALVVSEPLIRASVCPGFVAVGEVRALWGAGAFVIHRKRKHQQVLNTAEHDTIKSNMGCKTAGDSDALIILFLERGASVIMRAVWTPSLRRQPSTCARN